MSFSKSTAHISTRSFDIEIKHLKEKDVVALKKMTLVSYFCIRFVGRHTMVARGYLQLKYDRGNKTASSVQRHIMKELKKKDGVIVIPAPGFADDNDNFKARKSNWIEAGIPRVRNRAAFFRSIDESSDDESL